MAGQSAPALVWTARERPKCGEAVTFCRLEIRCLIQAGHREILHMGKAVTEDGRELAVSWRADGRPRFTTEDLPV